VNLIDLCERVIAPALRRVGDDWAAGRVPYRRHESPNPPAGTQRTEHGILCRSAAVRLPLTAGDIVGDLFDLAQYVASVLVTVREGRRAGFGGSVSGAWPPRACYPDGVWM
jgi:hypothetical protein